MKRVFPAILFALLSGIPVVNGQFVESMGLKAGVSLSNQSHRFTPIDYTLETKPIAGPAIAFFVEPFRGGHLSLQLDLAFTAKGSKTTTESITVNHLENNQIIVNEGKLQVSRFYYLSFSPMARYRIGNDRLSPYAVLGPRLDLLLKYKTDSDYPLEQQNDLILGLNGGIGLEYNLDKLGIFLEVQYQPDISPVTNIEPLLIKNNILIFTLGARYLTTQ